ncbi:Transcription intermediary factor 1-alpha [Mactra antiquata]
MALRGSILKTSEETFDFICTSCADNNLIKEALKYCVECQKYYCKDCLTSHQQFALLKGHTFLDNSSVKPQGQPSSLPAFPTKQCSQHIGKIMDMFCKTHDVVCCYVCAAEDHKFGCLVCQFIATFVYMSWTPDQC